MLESLSRRMNLAGTQQLFDASAFLSLNRPRRRRLMRWSRQQQSKLPLHRRLLAVSDAACRLDQTPVASVVLGPE
jgi:hypothetical protein